MADPRILVKNRESLVNEMRDEYGYIFCERCQKSNAYKFHVHHIVYRSERPNHAFLHEKINLLIVCDKCHDDFHNKKEIRNDLLIKRNLTKIFNIEI